MDGRPDLSVESRKRISEKLKGHPVSQETRDKITKAITGYKYPPRSAEHRRKIGEKHKGKITSEEAKEKNRQAQLGGHHSALTKLKMAFSHQGEKSSAWKGGISFEPYCEKFNNEFRERVRSFFDHKCVECGTPQNGEKLHIHHVNFNKESCCDSSVPLFVSLCRSCHAKTSHNREYWEPHFTEIINNYYEGKCYLTNDEMENVLSVIGCD